MIWTQQGEKKHRHTISVETGPSLDLGKNISSFFKV